MIVYKLSSGAEDRRPCRREGLMGSVAPSTWLACVLPGSASQDPPSEEGFPCARRADIDQVKKTARKNACPIVPTGEAFETQDAPPRAGRGIVPCLA